MNKLFTSIPDLALRLLALEAARQTAADAPQHEALRVLEKLRTSLSRFAGPEGFTALLQRALALARVDVPELKAVKIGDDGRLDGLDGLFAGADSPGVTATIAVTTYLLGLLTTFVGQPLMLRLVREAWPDAALVD